MIGCKPNANSVSGPLVKTVPVLCPGPSALYVVGIKSCNRTWFHLASSVVVVVVLFEGKIKTQELERTSLR